ncbi:hypothetical protein ACFLW0_06085 [Chloroflexota bacterium]
MAREKQYVFSARTTEEGLRLLNGLRKDRGIGWDDLVLDAVCDRYGLDRSVMAPPKKDRPAEEAENNQQPPAEQIGEERLAEATEEKPAGEAPNRKREKGAKEK